MAEPVDKREFLKKAAIGSIALASLPALGAALGAPASAHEEDERGEGRLAIHIHGYLSGTGTPVATTVKIAVSIDVAGQRRRKDGLEPLTGGGWDPGVGGTNQTTLTMVPMGSNGACYFAQAGALVGHEVRLKGFSLFTNRTEVPEDGRQDTRQDVRDVETKANLKTGFIEWRLGGARFEGFGVVEKISGNRRDD